MIIEKIEIESFRSIKNKIILEFPKSNLKIFIGPNNSGKSNILRALNFFFNQESEPNIKFNPARDISISGKKNSNITVVLRFDESDKRFITSYIDKNYSEEFNNYIIPITLRLNSNGSLQYIFTNKKGYKNTGWADLKDRILDYVNCIYIPAIKDYHNVINRDMMRKIVAASFHGWGRGPISRQLGKHREDFQKILDAIQGILNISGDSMSGMFQNVIKEIERFDFSLPYENLEDFLGRLVFKITEKSVDEKILLDSEGSGVQSYTIYSMLKLLHELVPSNAFRKSKFIWLIEEPETFMHHDLQRKTFTKLKDYSKDGHIFITTHSPIFIDKKDYSSAYIVTKNETTKIENISTKNIREVITGSIGVRFDELGLFNRFNILVEGETDKNLLLGLNKLFKKKNYDNLLDENETEFINCNSSNNMPHFFSLYNAFNQYGSFYAIFDRDGAGIKARNDIINQDIPKDFLYLIPESSHKKDPAIEDIVEKDIWDICIKYLDDKGLVEVGTKKRIITDYRYSNKNRVKVKKTFVKKLLEIAKKNLVGFEKYLQLIQTLKSKFDIEKKLG